MTVSPALIIFNIKLHNTVGQIQIQSHTCYFLGVHVVEYPVCGELSPVVSADLRVEHLQLALTLVELRVVALLQRYAGVRFIHLGKYQINLR